MGGGAGANSSSNITPTTLSTYTNTTTTSVGPIGLTGQDAVSLAAVLGQSAANADTLVQNLNQQNDATNVANNANMLNSQSAAYAGLLNQSGQNYTQLISGANNLLQAEQNFGTQEAQLGRDAFSAASALQTNQPAPTYSDLPQPSAIGSQQESSAGKSGLSTTTLILIAAGVVVLFFAMKE